MEWLDVLAVVGPEIVAALVAIFEALGHMGGRGSPTAAAARVALGRRARRRRPSRSSSSTGSRKAP